MFGEAKGIEPLFTTVHGELLVVSKKPLKTLADFNGEKLRVAGAAPLQAEPFKRVGASPVSMPLGEVVTALQNNAIDSAVGSYPVFLAFKYYDVAKNVTLIPGGFAVVSGLVNRRFLKSIGSELEAIVRQESIKAEEKFSTFGVVLNDRSREAWKRAGGQIHEMSSIDVHKYQVEVNAVIAGVVGSQPTMKADYQAIVAAAKQYR